MAGVDWRSPEASPEEGETMEEEGCGANTPLHPSIRVSLAVEMPFPAWEFCLMPPLLLLFSFLRGGAKSFGRLQYHVALPLFS